MIIWPAYAKVPVRAKYVHMERYSLGVAGFAIKSYLDHAESELRIRVPTHLGMRNAAKFAAHGDLTGKYSWPMMSLQSLANALADRNISLRAYIGLMEQFAYAEGQHFTNHLELLHRFKLDILRDETIWLEKNAGINFDQETEEGL